MGVPPLILALLLVGCFCLSSSLSPRFDGLVRKEQPGFLGSTLGESRKIFADHFFTRSDIYFHSGYYPSIFDRADTKSRKHVVEDAGAKESAHGEEKDGHTHGEHCDHSEEGSFLGKPKDPMDAFTRHFFVSRHTHLTEKGTNAAREILPWLKLASQLDPTKVDSYTVGAYWLRSLNRHTEAEQFLREGFRRNPQSHEILLELGRLHFEQRDYELARSRLELAFKCWGDQESSKPAEKQNLLAARQIANYLAVVEDRAGNRERALKWLQVVRAFSPDPAVIDKRIAEVRAGQPLSAE